VANAGETLDLLRSATAGLVAAIEAGADRTAAALIDDVRQTAEAFSAAATGMPASGWDREVRWTAGQVTPARLIVPSRWGEVLIHHVDLAIGYQPAHWPAAFTAGFLPLLVASLSGRDAAMEAVRLEATDTGHVFTIGETTPKPLGSRFVPGRQWTVTLPDELIPLDGGGRSVVYRRGDVVIRETGPWAPAVHALLRHLEQAGFTAAPRLVGPGLDSGGREMLTFIEGEFTPPGRWTRWSSWPG
jgi:hypothetical protein